MKKYVRTFLHRGLMACGLGPLVLAVLYLILHQQSVVETLTVREVCMGIFSLSALAFIAGGMNTIYQMERLPLLMAILIHGGVLYVGYLATYLLNNWLDWGAAPILVFSGIFVLGYLAIWAIIYTVIRKRTQKLNAILRQKQQSAETDVMK